MYEIKRHKKLLLRHGEGVTVLHTVEIRQLKFLDNFKASLVILSNKMNLVICSVFSRENKQTSKSQ